ncbi:hypothetical protein [Streptacidiphilus sp. EB129]|jgi:hypothetical protein|uniref:hypothetical protein n=1 Tax=Streptacidiphilus sp. EB129 TaxID=3156262 RepID=UPI003514CCB6
MSIALFVIAGLIAFGTLVSIARIGKPRETPTAAVVAVSTAISACEVVVLVLAALNR